MEGAGVQGERRDEDTALDPAMDRAAEAVSMTPNPRLTRAILWFPHLLKKAQPQ